MSNLFLDVACFPTLKYFTNANDFDVLMYSEVNTQNIHIGCTSNAPSMIKITNSNVEVNGPLLMTSIDSSNAPGYAWADDSNTGMYHVAKNVIGFSSGGKVVATLSNTTATFSNINATSISGNGTGLTNLNASSISTGIVNQANLPVATSSTLGIVTLTATLPAGLVSYFAMITAPVGWLVCDGSYVSTTTYAALFAAIGTLYGSGSGTFKLPDLRGEFLRGVDNGRGVDSGRSIGSFQNHQFEDHKHAFNRGSGLWVNYGGGDIASPGSFYTNAGNATVEWANSGNRGAETRPRNVALLACIKY